MKYSLIAVDLQNEFASKGGKGYSYKPSVDFVKEKLIPYLKKNNLKFNEIISDYRQPRPGDSGDMCYPGEWGYQPILPDSLRKSLWVKSMNSPIWIRENIGEPNKEPGIPYPDSKAFGEWLKKNIGEPKEVIPMVFGLTLDCCVLCTLQELSWRGYEPLILKEGVDHRTGKKEDKRKVLETVIGNWSEVIGWRSLKEKIQ